MAFSLLLIHQHRARGAHHHQELQQLFLNFVAGQLTEQQYERDLACALTAE